MGCDLLSSLTALLGLSSSWIASYASLPLCNTRLSVAQSSKIVQFEVHLTSARSNPTGAGFRDTILVNVRNYLREDTSVHFHGIGQGVSPWADGTPGTSQRSIRPGASFLYRWQADESGVFFYHAHSRGQMMDGLYGSIIVNPRDDEERPFHIISRNSNDWAKMRKAEKELQTLMISDWSQYKFHDFYNIEERANIDYTCMDAIIVNGEGSQYCLDRELLDAYTDPLLKYILSHTEEPGITDKGCVPPLQLFQGNFTLHLDDLPSEAYHKCIPGVGGGGNHTVSVHSGQGWAALTFINPGGLYPLKVTIDNHPLHVYAVDGAYIYPQTVDQILVNNGERYSVLIKLDQEVGNYKIRIANDLLGQVLGGFATLSYNDAAEDAARPRPAMNYAGQPLIDPLRKFEVLDARPYPPHPPPATSDRTFKFNVRKLGQPFGAYEWTLSGTEGLNITAEDATTPILFSQHEIPSKDELILHTRKNEWVDLIIEVEGPFAQSHPMHKHGNKAYVIGAGIGSFPWASIAEASKVLPHGTFNFIDAPYKDTFKTLEGVNNDSWLALRYKADAPGAWLFHCHIQTHLTGGMGIVILDGVDDWPKVPERYLEWNGFDQPT
ncbi:hypothetical protein ACN47E_006483 [Coniothyrium glycines]